MHLLECFLPSLECFCATLLFFHHPSRQATPLKWETLDYQRKRDESENEKGMGWMNVRVRWEMSTKKKNGLEWKKYRMQGKTESFGEHKIEGKRRCYQQTEPFSIRSFASRHFLWPYPSIHPILLWSSSSSLTLFYFSFRRYPTRAIVMFWCCYDSEREIMSWLIALGFLQHLFGEQKQTEQQTLILKDRQRKRISAKAARAECPQ